MGERAALREQGTEAALARASFGSGKAFRAQQFPIRLEQSFLWNAPDGWIDTILAMKERMTKQCNELPEGARMVISVGGEGGGYCENDNRVVCFELVLEGETKRSFRTTCSFDTSAFNRALERNTARFLGLLELV